LRYLNGIVLLFSKERAVPFLALCHGP